MEDNIERKAYPRTYPGKATKRGRGRPCLSPGQKEERDRIRRETKAPVDGSGRPKGSTGIKPKIDNIVSKEIRDIVQLRARAITEAVLQEEMRLAFSDIRFLPGIPQNIPDEIAYAIKSLKMVPKIVDGKPLCDNNGNAIYEFDVGFWDKGRALERLSRHLGLYEQDNKQKGEAEKRPQINLYLEQGGVQMMVPGGQVQLPGPEANGYGEK